MISTEERLVGAQMQVFHAMSQTSEHFPEVDPNMSLVEFAALLPDMEQTILQDHISLYDEQIADLTQAARPLPATQRRFSPFSDRAKKQAAPTEGMADGQGRKGGRHQRSCLMSVEGLSSAVSGLLAHRRRLDVISHNVANASTEGYSRQRVDLTANSGSAIGIWSGSSSSLGGVTIDGISRSRDAFLEVRSLTTSANAAELERSYALHLDLEEVLAEPSDSGVAAAFDDLWAAFDDVANFPDQLPQRVALVNSATILTERLGEADSGFRALHTSTRQTTEATVATANSIAEEIAAINHAVATASGGTNTNDLLDQRDAAVSRLAELTGARISQRDNGTIDVYVGNSSIVQGSRTFELSVTDTADLGLTPVGLQRTDIMIGGSVRMTSLGGELAGLLSNVNSSIPSALSTLDGVTAQLISDVNTLHTTGEDLDGNAGGAFFSGTSAATISVDAAIVADPRTIAAASPGSGIRDGEIALGIAELRNSATGADSLYESFSVTLGLATSSLQRRSSAQSEAAAKVDEARLAARSVSLDEEMVDLVATQRAYEASARVVSAIDQMLDTLVNRLGTVGR